MIRNNNNQLYFIHSAVFPRFAHAESVQRIPTHDLTPAGFLAIYLRHYRNTYRIVLPLPRKRLPHYSMKVISSIGRRVLLTVLFSWFCFWMIERWILNIFGIHTRKMSAARLEHCWCGVVHIAQSRLKVECDKNPVLIYQNFCCAYSRGACYSLLSLFSLFVLNNSFLHIYFNRWSSTRIMRETNNKPFLYYYFFRSDFFVFLCHSSVYIFCYF